MTSWGLPRPDGSYAQAMLPSRYRTVRASIADADTRTEHCLHWQDGDGACCRCHEPTWCPEEGENPESLARFTQRRHACTTADAARVVHTRTDTEETH